MLTVKQMKALERAAQKKGIFSIDLMENAGKQVYQIVKEKFNLTDKHIFILAGTGNNGGDGLVSARYFSENNPTIVLLFGDEDNFSEETKSNYNKIKDYINIIKIKNDTDLKQFRIQKDIELILIDALLGTGISEDIREPISFGIDYFNQSNGIKVSIDIPSGINPDTGEASNKFCNPELIITLHDLKAGMQHLKEKTVIVDIGIPNH